MTGFLFVRLSSAAFAKGSARPLHLAGFFFGASSLLQNRRAQGPRGQVVVATDRHRVMRLWGDLLGTRKRPPGPPTTIRPVLDGLAGWGRVSTPAQRVERPDLRNGGVDPVNRLSMATNPSMGH